MRLIAPGFRLGEDQFASRLIVESGPAHKGVQYLLSGPGPIELGKLADRHIPLDGQRVSRLHCRLVRSSDGWRVADAKSTNGTFINNDRVDGAELYDGDELTVGDYVLRFHGRARSRAAVPPPPVPAPEDQGLLGDDLYALSEGDAVEVAPPEEAQPHGAAVSAAAPTGGPVCPSCERSLAPNAKICVFCGIDLKTGRAIITADEGRLDSVYAKAEGIIPWLSWVVPSGIYPIASEALGTRRPFVVYALAILTIITTVWFWQYERSDSPEMARLKNYYLWTGSADPSPELLYYGYTETSWGDSEAFEEELERQQKKAATAQVNTRGRRSKDEEDEDEDEDWGDGITSKMIVAAHEALPPEKQCLGQFHGYQLITHAFLHADFWHIAGNLFFMLFFGSRVNALIGNVATVLLYPLLAIFAALAMLVSENSSEPGSCLGASGAVMGLAGLYLALMPIHKIHMAGWLRWGFIGRFRLHMKIFAVRGFWVVLFYIKYDILFTLLKLETGVAHWAHLGGLLAGLGLGIALLMTRLVSARGGDIVSALLGKRAWSFVGKPNPEKKPLLQWLP